MAWVLVSTLFVITSTTFTSAWVPISPSQFRAGVNPTLQLLITPDPSNPCWQDNFDSEDDCLSTVYSAAFVAEDWIKSMPCGKDADCLPEQLSHPGTMGDSGVELVNVMEYLNIKKVPPVTARRDYKGES